MGNVHGPPMLSSKVDVREAEAGSEAVMVDSLWMLLS